jgi:myosin I
LLVQGYRLTSLNDSNYRRPFDEFIVQFKFIDLALCKNESLGHSEIVKGIMKKAGIPSSSFHIGKTMVFAKTPVLKQLLKAQREIMSDLEPLVSILEAMILRRDALNSIENVMGSLIRFQANTRRYVVSLS